MRELFVRDDDDAARLRTLVSAFRDQLDAAESVLDGIANEACVEARRVVPRPAPLEALVGEVRELSSR